MNMNWDNDHYLAPEELINSGWTKLGEYDDPADEEITEVWRRNNYVRLLWDTDQFIVWTLEYVRDHSGSTSFSWRVINALVSGGRSWFTLRNRVKQWQDKESGVSK